MRKAAAEGAAEGAAEAETAGADSAEADADPSDDVTVVAPTKKKKVEISDIGSETDGEDAHFMFVIVVFFMFSNKF